MLRMNSGTLMARASTARRAGYGERMSVRTWKATRAMNTTSPVSSMATAAGVEAWSTGSARRGRHVTPCVRVCRFKS